ncbi:MAG: tetratricopeptide repeat protein [Nocardiopsaceae bacterium]|nr:tetratricopeptide repeat protein [Nocardiopsaceae bacterium]
MTAEHAAGRTRVVAFHSHSGGIGRSCALANLSLILAAWGHRVLVVDTDRAAPSLHRYLAPFLPPSTTGSTGDPGRDGEPVRLACHFDDPDGSVDFLPRVPAAVRREDLLGRYDYVLIDVPAGAESVPLVGELADVVLLGFELDDAAIDATARHARDIRGCERGTAIRLLPVPMKVHQDAGTTLPQLLGKARLRLFWLLDDMPADRRWTYWDDIGVPYEPGYALDAGLAFLDEHPDRYNRLAHAYRRLAAEARGRSSPVGAGSVTAQTLERYRAAREVMASASAAVTVLHAPRDRYWAEWLADELRDMGRVATRRRIGEPVSGSQLLVVSGALLELLEGDERHRAASPPVPAPDGQDQDWLGVSIDGTRLPHNRFPALAHLDLAGKGAEQAREELASYYQLSPAPETWRQHRAHYPAARRDPAASPPAADGPCYGREDEIDQIRDHFTAGITPAPLTITGEPGVGKSRLALEYALRFAGYYDVVFRIQADSQHAVRAGLRELARTARIRPERPSGDAERDVLRHLVAGRDAPERWLLIYDGAQSPQALASLLPKTQPGPGRHVLLTGRTLVAQESGELPVRALPQRVAGVMLSDLVPGLLPGHAAWLAETLGGVPLAIQLAAAWLKGAIRQVLREGVSYATVTGNAVQELRTQLDSWFAEAGTSSDPVRAMTELLIRLLRTEPQGKAALVLGETCAFLAPSGMPDELFRSGGMIGQLAEVDNEIADPVVLQNVRQALVRLGFTPGGSVPGEPLRLHPRVREILRERMTPDDRQARSLSVTRMLAASVPLDVDDVSGHAELYSELLGHVEPSGAPLQTDDGVRRWLLGQVRFLWQQRTVPARQMAIDLAERLADHWAVSVSDGDEDHLLLRLRAQLAIVRRARGEFTVARALDADVLRKQRRVLGKGHLRTLMTAQSYGADLRLAGRFEEALNEDQSTWQALSDALGDDHPMTIVASSNMALAELMAGYPETALERQQVDVARCERLRSELPGQGAWILSHIGILQRELGRYDESHAVLADAKAEFDVLIDAGRVAPALSAVLFTDAGLAITQRRQGRPDERATRRTLRACRDTYGDLYPYVLALELSLAGDLHALERHSEAVERAEAARAGHQRMLGDAHPFTRICEVNLSGYALADGQHARALELSEAALAALRHDLTPGHLWTQAARVAHANALVADGHLDEALKLEESAHAEYRRQLGPGNRLAVTVAGNIADTRRSLAGPARVPAGHRPVRVPAIGQGKGGRHMIELDVPPY